MKNQTFITNQRDKNLLIILAGIVVAFLLFYFVTTPLIDQTSLLRAEAKTAKENLETTKNLVAQMSDLKKLENEKKQQLTSKYAPFFYDLNEEGLLHKLDTLMAEAGLIVNSYDSSLAAASSIPVISSGYQPVTFPLKDLATITNPELAEPNQGAAQIPVDQAASGEVPAEDAASPDSVATVDISLNFGPTAYPTIMGFVGKLESLEKTVIIKDLSTGTEEGGRLSGSMTLSLYALPKLDQSEATYLQFFPAFGKGKADPFQ